MLTDRQKLILIKIIEEFVKTAEPVGSRTLSKLEDLPYSPATLRNEMADLEDMGFLEKTHTSSGRVPSEKGYRFYVDHIITNKSYEDNEYPVIDSIFSQKQLVRNEAIKETVKILSEITNYTSFVLGPNGQKSRVKRFQFIPIDSKTAVLILVTDGGHVQSTNLNFDSEIEINEIEKIVNILNELLVDTLVTEIPEKLHYDIKPHLSQYINYQEKLIDKIIAMFGQMTSDNVFLSGQSRLISLPEFRDVNKLTKLYRAIEEKQVLSVIRETDSGMSIRIGHENQVQAMNNCTLITVPYKIGKNEYGKIAVLGPTRMEYSKVIPLLEYIAKLISNMYD